MEIKISKDTLIMNLIASFAIGTGVGVFCNKYYNLKHTPEETLKKLEVATSEKKAAEKSYNEQYGKYREAYDKLVKTKEAYQDEVRKELEPKIREEFKEYIDKADETYAKAKHENDVASLKLELIKEYKKNIHVSPSGTGVSFDFKI